MSTRISYKGIVDEERRKAKNLASAVRVLIKEVEHSTGPCPVSSPCSRCAAVRQGRRALDEVTNG